MRSVFAVLVSVAALSCATARAADVTVFAAVSLSDALPAIEKSYEAKTHHTAAFSFAASSVPDPGLG